jgi:hypothetical protein
MDSPVFTEGGALMARKLKAIKLTVAEKEARGTRQAGRDVPRALDEVQTEIAETRESLLDMQFNLREAGKAIRKEGVLIDVITRSNTGMEVRTKKLNPACRLQRDMLTAIKSVKRALVLLYEEEEMALRAERPVEDEFVGLD